MAEESRPEATVQDTIPQEDSIQDDEHHSHSYGETDTTDDCHVDDQTPTASREGTPPPLPPRPSLDSASNHRPPSSAGSLRMRAGTLQPNTSIRTPFARATTALSLADIHVQSHTTRDEGHTSPTSRQVGYAASHTAASRRGSVEDDAISVMSYAPTLQADGDMESMLGDVEHARATPGMKPLTPMIKRTGVDEDILPPDPVFDEAYEHEFDELDDLTSDGLNEEAVVQQWKAKLKHFLILSNAGKPVWTRHGNDQLITSYIGVVQTLISFYEGASESLRGFTAAGVRFVVMTKGSLNLVAISKLGESDQQLRSQLEALYMQILSTLTLPVMERMFKNRASTDLRRPLQGTESLLSALADGFTRGSPSTLLSSLECLKLRKAHRTVINNTLLKARSDNLLYGLVVAGGRLVSVVRPRKHSLHPGDLHLIFNMLFEAGSVKAGGGENWIPLCLPGFNNTGYLYMYVSFLNLDNPSEEMKERPPSSSGSEEEVAILLISANKEGFFELRAMRDELVKQLRRNGSLELIRQAVHRGRPQCTDIIPGTVLRHFLYKSRGNVQFIMPSFSPSFNTAIARRRVYPDKGNQYAEYRNEKHPEKHPEKPPEIDGQADRP
ncbi:Vacuolar fusion protein mon1 [Venturia effusa]|uniref:Vacuolar fusion protein MON1 n=1 Tax=Venturia effusa TaxID=50376 RepID=A0A517L6N5_9PEZI|nr:Vacuolar fusion protein mon1 [Venturia effusa]